MGPEGLDPSKMSARDKEMMGLGTRLETEEPDDKGGYKPTPEAVEKSLPSKPLKEATTKSRFANLELTPPGMRGEELKR